MIHESVIAGQTNYTTFHPCRCTFGNWACSAGCVLLGQSSGLCDDHGACWCSENSINFDHFRALLPSRCDLGESVCTTTCHSMGRANGTCNRFGCECSDRWARTTSHKGSAPFVTYVRFKGTLQTSSRFISPSEFLLCGADSTCRIHCQVEREDRHSDKRVVVVTEAIVSSTSSSSYISTVLPPQRKGHGTGVCEGWSCECKGA